MSSSVISVENVGKAYRLGVIGGGTLQGDFARWWARVRRKPDPLLRVGSPVGAGERGQVVWALRDVCLEAEPGQVVGIIGRNGAGKSTLLKILSRVTAPSVGTVRMKGRVGSLLEVGTGFHPELTGRENIFLNGAMLGMRKAQIRSRLEEIVEFAEVGEYLDTPVKRYSSGMYVRLAFAVAAHLEPEILLVDEVLAVGDVMFQRKCIGKMSDVAHGGRTVLFVSHNMGSVSRLCTSAVLLEAGRIVMRGPVNDVVGRYLTVDASSGATDLAAVRERTGDGRARFTRAVTRNAAGDECDTFTIGDDIAFDLEMDFLEPVREGRMSLQVNSASGIPVYHLVAVDSDFPLLQLEDRVAVRVTLRDQRLYPGEYFVSLWLADSGYGALDRVSQAFKFTVTTGGRLVTRELDGASATVHEIAEWERLV
jgi:lipopolysaccharide transport system ATP-binding protein